MPLSFLRQLTLGAGLLTLTVPAVAQALPPAECGRGGMVQPCRLTPTHEGLTVLFGAGAGTSSLDIPGSSVLLYTYLRKASEHELFASGYHRDFAARLARNYAYAIDWRTAGGTAERLVVSFGDADTNRRFYPLMRQLTGLELGVPRP